MQCSWGKIRVAVFFRKPVCPYNLLRNKLKNNELYNREVELSRIGLNSKWLTARIPAGFLPSPPLSWCSSQLRHKTNQRYLNLHATFQETNPVLTYPVRMAHIIIPFFDFVNRATASVVYLLTETPNNFIFLPFRLSLR